MKLKDALKKAKPATYPRNDAEFDVALHRVARAVAGAGPGEPAYEAIVHPPRRGRPAKGAVREGKLVAVRLPEELLRRVKAKARRRHLAVSEALREAAAIWAAK